MKKVFKKVITTAICGLSMIGIYKCGFYGLANFHPIMGTAIVCILGVISLTTYDIYVNDKNKTGEK